MGFKILILVVVLAVIATVVLIPKGIGSKKFRQAEPVDLTFEDSPVSFGYKNIWFAVKTTDQKGVAQQLGLRNITLSNWNNGINKAYEGSVFITPGIDGWTLAVGWGLPAGDSKESLEAVKALANKLSERYGESQFFGTHRVVEYHCWLRSVNGKIERLYSYIGERGENLAVEGEPTVFEKQYNLVNTLSAEAQNDSYFDREDLEFPNEELVMKIAGEWSVNPLLIESNNNIQGLGLLGTLK